MIPHNLSISPEPWYHKRNKLLTEIENWDRVDGVILNGPGNAELTEFITTIQ